MSDPDNATLAYDWPQLDAPLEQMDLNDLRQQIDGVDRALLKLIHRRVDIGHQVGEIKRQTSDSPVFLRPAREAKMLRVLAQRHRDQGRADFPTSTVLYVWRELIASTTAMEGTLRLSLMADQNRTCRKNAVLHFSATLEQINRSAGIEVLDDVLSGRAELGVVALEDAWWQADNLGLAPGQAQVFARLPFIDEPAQRLNGVAETTFTIAKFGLEEPTGDDVTLVVVEDPTQLQAHQSLQILDKRNGKSLVAVPGYLSAEDLGDAGTPGTAKIIGRYARPIVL